MPDTLPLLYPEWLWALLPLPLLLWAYGRRAGGLAAWRRVIQPHLLPHLVSEMGQGSSLPRVLLALGWTLAVLALADPAWERQPTPLHKSRAAWVILLDLSQSMATPDLPPSRLIRARYKVADLLGRNRDGQNALVVFAGDAFVVSPLTEDGATITALLAALEPGIMPVQGSRADLGLRKAGELLAQAGLNQGEVLLITDDADGRAEAAARALRERGYLVSVLGVGTSAGAPLPDGRGGFVQGPDGKPVVAALPEESLRQVAAAGGGRYALISGGDDDLRMLLPAAPSPLETPAEDTHITGERWKEQGPLLVLLLLPLGALAFRRGWLLGLASLCCAGLSTPDPVLAYGWDDLWWRPDQQAAEALQRGEAERAARLAQDPMQQGIALYRGGDLAQALDRFRQVESADAQYNRGNTLAMLGQYPEAIAAYEEALARAPGMEDAAYNKAQVEALLKQRQEQSQPPSGGGGDQEPSPSGGEPSQADHPSQGDGGTTEHQTQSSQAQRGDPSQPSSDQDQSGQRGAAGHDPSGGGDAESRPGSSDPSQAMGSQRGQQDTQGDSANPAGTGTRAEAQGNAADAQIAQQPDRADEKAQPPAGSDPPQGTPAQGAPAEGKEPRGSDPHPTLSDAEPLDTEQRQAIDQWLRRIPDDPGGLLRRKLLYQYRERPPQVGNRGERPW